MPSSAPETLETAPPDVIDALAYKVDNSKTKNLSIFKYTNNVPERNQFFY